MRKNLLAPIIFLVALAVTGGYIYINSAKFIETPTIIMPGDATGQIEYTNRNILSEIVIDTENFGDVITALSRPSEYSMTVVNTLYAYDTQQSFLTYVNAKNSNIKASTENLEYLLVNNVLNVRIDGEIKQVNTLDLTADDIMGIPTYEDVINLDTVEKVALHTINNEQVIVVTSQNENLGTTNRYYISLSTGMLSSYEVVLGEKLLRFVTIKDLKIAEQEQSIFLFE